MVDRAQRLTNLAKRSFPEGTFAVGAGMAIAGLSAYGFQSFAGRALSKPDYAALNGLWVLTFVLAPGFFLPLEQEVGRALAHRRVQGMGGAPLVKRASILGGLLTLGMIAAVSIASPWLVADLFHGKWPLFAALVIALVAYYAQHITRGVLAGNGRFGPYGVLMGGEGLVRMIPAALLALAGVAAPGWYGMVFAGAALVAVFLALRGQHGLLKPGPAAGWSELSSALGWLLAASVLAQLLGYAAFLAVALLAEPDQKTLVGDFIQGFFIARIPILLFQAVQAALLPKLAGLVGSGRTEDFLAGLRKLVVIVLTIGVLGVIGGYTIGPTAGRILFGGGQQGFILDRNDLALLAAGSGAFILTLTLAQAVIALKAYARSVAAWLTGIVVFVIVTALSADAGLLGRAEIGFLAGALAAAGVMTFVLLTRLRAGIPDTAIDELVEGIEHEPLEI